MTRGALWALVVVVPVLFWVRLVEYGGRSMVVVDIKDAFRLPKLMASEWLGLASLLGLAWTLRAGGGSLRFWTFPAVRGWAPYVAVATLGLALTGHPLQTREGLIDLWIGSACLVGWSAAISSARLKRWLTGLVVPGALLALLAILQFRHIFRPFAFAGGVRGRLSVSSLAGNPTDLGCFLLLPILILQAALPARRGWHTAVLTALLAVCAYGLVATQTLTPLLAATVASALHWLLRLPRRRALAALALILLVALGMAVGIPRLRLRIKSKVEPLAHGEMNEVLTGRLDGWRSALWMLARHPWSGVGQGAYEAEFSPAKLALEEAGVRFYRGHRFPSFANAHNEVLEVGAELGVPGLLALAWALWVLGAAARRAGAGTGAKKPVVERALLWSGLAGTALLAVFDFPFRIALSAYPTLLFVAWILARSREAEASAP